MYIYLFKALILFDQSTIKQTKRTKQQQNVFFAYIKQNKRKNFLFLFSFCG